ncbi:MAG: DUF6279 family lipoprotein [Parahaliea sp.]
MKAYSRWFIPLMLMAALAGCSSTSFMYKRADMLVAWYVDDYVELDRQQSQQLDRLLRPVLDWHQQQELPRYSAIVAAAEQFLDEDISNKELQQLTADVDQAIARLRQRSLDWVLPLAASLNERQVAELLTNMEKEQADRTSDYLERDEDEYRKDIYERIHKPMRRYLGRLSARQRDQLQLAITEMVRMDSLYLQDQAAWIERLRLILQRQPGWQQRLRQAVETRWENATEQYRQSYSHNYNIVQMAVVKLINGRTRQQDKHLRRELERLQEELNELSRPS